MKSPKRFSMSLLFSLSFSSVLLFACAHRVTMQSTQHESAPWVGTWQWNETSGGFAGQITTPSSSGKTKTLVLHADSTFVMLENDHKVASGAFQIHKGSSIYQSEEALIFDFQEEQPWFHHPLSQNMPKNYILELKEECHDCYTYQFERVSGDKK